MSRGGKLPALSDLIDDNGPAPPPEPQSAETLLFDLRLFKAQLNAGMK